MLLQLFSGNAFEWNTRVHIHELHCQSDPQEPEIQYAGGPPGIFQYKRYHLQSMLLLPSWLTQLLLLIVCHHKQFSSLYHLRRLQPLAIKEK